MSSGADPDPVEDIEKVLLDGPARYTRSEVVEKADIDLERAQHLWRALGFPSVSDEDVAFNDRDVEALKLLTSLIDRGVVSQEAEASLARSLGQSMARMADWQVALLGNETDAAEASTFEAESAALDIEDLVAEVDALQSYVWRRHLVAATGRLIPVDDEGENSILVCGFADMVGFTKLSRALDDEQLTELVERFESSTSSIIAEHGGRVVKTIGDEIMFVVREPGEAAGIAFELLEWIETDEDLPKLRIGMAHGPVQARLGDVYGPTVNVAARLTSTARPNTALIDANLAEELSESDSVRLRKTKRVSVRGYAHLEPWVLRKRE